MGFSAVPIGMWRSNRIASYFRWPIPSWIL